MRTLHLSLGLLSQYSQLAELELIFGLLLPAVLDLVIHLLHRELLLLKRIVVLVLRRFDRIAVDSGPLRLKSEALLEAHRGFPFVHLFCERAHFLHILHWCLASSSDFDRKGRIGARLTA